MTNKKSILSVVYKNAYNVKTGKMSTIETSYHYNEQCLFTYPNPRFDKSFKTDLKLGMRAEYDAETGEKIPTPLPLPSDAEIKKAKDGCTLTARLIASAAADCLRNDKPMPSVLTDYLVDGLQSIASGGDAREAFYTQRKRGKQRRGDMTYAKLGALMMEEALKEGAENFHQASLQVFDKLREKGNGIDDSTIRKAHREQYPERYQGGK